MTLYKQIGMIIRKFPNEKEADELGGFLEAPFIFCRVFPHVNKGLKEIINEISTFLINNGYRGIRAKDLDEALCYESPEETVSVSPHGYLEAFVLFITDKEGERQYHSEEV